MSQGIQTHSSLEAFFNELLEDALHAERLSLSQPSAAYVLKLISGFAKGPIEGARNDEPGTPALVWLYERAANSAPTERFQNYRRLGDVALFVSGFFAPHIERSLVDVSYYVQMGGNAYTQAANLASRGFDSIFTQLATKFSRLVEVLTRIAEQTTLPVANDVLSIYERWLRTPDSASLHQRLSSRGTIPLLAPIGSQ